MDGRPTQTRRAFILQMGFSGFMVTHFVLVAAAGILLYLTGWDWTYPLVLAALAAALVAVVLSLTAMWLDYRSGYDRSAPREFLQVMFVGSLIVGPAAYLEKAYGFNWWLAAGAMAIIVFPPWVLYLRRRHHAAR
jgi:uncharacterized integral membrane protein